MKLTRKLAVSFLPLSTQLTSEVTEDIRLAAITLKYTQSNSVCLAQNGQAIGVAAGQQSRVDAVKLATRKAKLW